MGERLTHHANARSVLAAGSDPVDEILATQRVNRALRCIEPPGRRWSRWYSHTIARRLNSSADPREQPP